ncbi:Hpt domain-containing protein [Roseovarius sp. M141]|uniref:Hpt domain-containing protein n=1 Tax=Roseovarius sp. M141 TaxID=2583806 RepID=UPI0020CCFF5C|nr:Hpt domain-containing protein [Roseovarius sp. M141]MCQ0091483.1 Hpt domain-containing protein [Roseovarius sp. M141]
MIDWSRVRELQNEIGAEDFGEVVEIFLEEVESEIADLHAGCDPAQLEYKFHSLRGSALNLGFRAFAEHCQTGETAAAQSQHSQIDVPATRTIYDLSKTEFLTRLNQQSR